MLITPRAKIQEIRRGREKVKSESKVRRKTQNQERGRIEVTAIATISHSPGASDADLSPWLDSAREGNRQRLQVLRARRAI